MTSDFEHLKEELKKFYDTERLAVFMIGGEQIIGEVVGIGSDNPSQNMIVGVPVQIRNPKRYMRLQKVNQQGTAVAVDFFVGALDGVEHDGSVMQILAMAAYWIHELALPSQITFLKILDGFFKQKMIAKAMGAGLALPSNLVGGLGGKG
jgi:hypothetical protein